MLSEYKHITRISSGTANSLLGFASLHILAKNYQPLKWALCFRDIMIERKSNPNEWSTLLYELDDAKEHLESLVSQLNGAGKIDEEDFKIQLSHIYAHVNRSWNIRNIESDFKSQESAKLSHFPTDLDPL
jgi:hypothetical protein